jgi:hypothetical protein
MAKKSKTKLPKRIGGVKIPKALRTGTVAAVLASPLGQNLIAEVIYHAGAALAGDSKGAKKTLKRVRRGALNAGEETADLAQDGAALIAYAFREGAERFVAAIREVSGGAKDLGASAVNDDRDVPKEWARH